VHDTIRHVTAQLKMVCIAGPTASGKSSRGVEEALLRGGEVISVDSRQVYRTFDIGTEKISVEEMRGVSHHLIDIRDPQENYSAGDFRDDATRLITEISARGNVPILVGGTHFYFDALINGIPKTVASDPALRAELEKLETAELMARITEKDPRRAAELDPNNRRRLVRALEVINTYGTVPPRPSAAGLYEVEWILINPPLEELRPRIATRLENAFSKGLVEEVTRVRAQVGDARLNELGLEYRIVGEYLRGERTEESMAPMLLAKLSQYARRQKAWLRKLAGNKTIVAIQ
jgi:tRNA dimethylallyltransferase